MRLIGIISTAALALSLGALPGYAQEQHDQQDEHKDKAAEQNEKKAQPEKSAKQEERGGQPEKNAKPEEKNNQRAQTEPGHPAKEMPQPNGKGGSRIPDDRFKANFGREHRFHVSQADYSRDRRFQYGGYWFGFIDPWPSNWLYTQDVFVVEINGIYYLCNATYPGVNLAISVTM
jgi:hypothetical protein